MLSERLEELKYKIETIESLGLDDILESEIDDIKKLIEKIENIVDSIDIENI